MIDLTFADPVVELGGRVEVTVRWQLDKKVQSFDLRLGWSTSGFGDEVSELVAHQVVELTDADRQSGSRQVVWDIPLGQPVTYRGEDLTVRWTVRADLDVKWGRDQRAAAELVVAPVGGRDWWRRAVPG